MNDFETCSSSVILVTPYYNALVITCDITAATIIDN